MWSFSWSSRSPTTSLFYGDHQYSLYPPQIKGELHLPQYDGAHLTLFVLSLLFCPGMPPLFFCGRWSASSTAGTASFTARIGAGGGPGCHGRSHGGRGQGRGRARIGARAEMAGIVELSHNRCGWGRASRCDGRDWGRRWCRTGWGVLACDGFVVRRNKRKKKK